ncbi:hypothetical protein NLI96_g6650 [Meripilus lineatus]|uniref:Uncharacterized protein n=1 Tax=Meripilus lineatus TaxID=2056292 RepID=A0AAD5YHW7_9APHY|nr:hypothetical protein NLI96_g6650 [Physisporinus lineatus]
MAPTTPPTGTKSNQTRRTFAPSGTASYCLGQQVQIHIGQQQWVIGKVAALPDDKHGYFGVTYTAAPNEEKKTQVLAGDIRAI